MFHGFSWVKSSPRGMLFSNLAHAMDRRHSHTRLFHARVANLQAAANQHQIPKELYSRIKRHYYYVPRHFYWLVVGDLPIENGDLPIENGEFIYWLGTNFRWFDND